jgi:hypothetical protein
LCKYKLSIKLVLPVQYVNLLPVDGVSYHMVTGRRN